MGEVQSTGTPGGTNSLGGSSSCGNCGENTRGGPRPNQTQTFVGLESAASAQIQFEVVRIPGLL